MLDCNRAPTVPTTSNKPMKSTRKLSSWSVKTLSSMQSCTPIAPPSILSIKTTGKWSRTAKLPSNMHQITSKHTTVWAKLISPWRSTKSASLCLRDKRIMTSLLSKKRHSNCGKRRKRRPVSWNKVRASFRPRWRPISRKRNGFWENRTKNCLKEFASSFSMVKYPSQL